MSQGKVVIGATYEHYKGKHYRVIDLVRHSETLESMVFYECLYENDLGRLWVRPMDLFTGTLEVDGKVVERFRRLEP